MAESSYEAVPMNDIAVTPGKSSGTNIPPVSPGLPSEAGLQEASLQEASPAEEESGRSSAISKQSHTHMQGWRAGATGVTCLVAAVLLINLCFLIWALSSHRLTSGIATLHRGSCDTSTNLNAWIHLVINLLSTGMLSGSNYCR